MARKTHHVIPSPQGGWEVRKGGSQRTSVHTNTKQEAIDAGRKIAREESTEFVIHGKSGQILRAASGRPTLRESEVREAVRNLNKELTSQNSKRKLKTPTSASKEK